MISGVMMSPTKRPFVGLRAFDYADRELFFGREDELDNLARLVDEIRFVAVVGSSGSGKSSLVRAGLRPRLEAATTQRWICVDMHPGGSPVKELARALAGLAEDDNELAEAWRDRIELLLRRSSFGISEAISLLTNQKDKTVLLIIDQFEELFRFANVPSGDSEAAARRRDEATAFVRLLLTAADARDLPVHIVLTMRSDFIGDCAHFHGLPEAATHGQFLVPGLTRDQRAAAVKGPIDHFGAHVDPGLVQRVLNDTSEDPDQLPLLQHAMMRCWDRAVAETQTNQVPKLTLDHYAKVGGLAEALSRHANEILASLSADDALYGMSLELATKRIFQALTDADREGRIVRRPQRFCDLAKCIGTDDNGEPGERSRRAATIVIGRFASPDCSFLRAPESLHDDSIVDIGHEALIRRWEKLKSDGETDWMREEQEDGDRYRFLLRLAATNGIITGEELPATERWWQRRKPNLFWARRYTKSRAVNFEDVRRLLERSRARADELEQQRRDAERATREAQESLLRAEAAEKVAHAEKARAQEAERLAMAQLEIENGRVSLRLQRIYWSIGVAILFITATLSFSFYYYDTQKAQQLLDRENETFRQRVEFEKSVKDATIQQEKSYKSKTIASAADFFLRPRIASGPADALAIALAKPDDLPDVALYEHALYSGLAELHERRRINTDPASEPRPQVYNVSFSPSKKLLFAVLPKELRFYRTDDGEFFGSWPVDEPGFITARWSPDGERIYVGTNQSARVVTPCSLEKLREYFTRCNGQKEDVYKSIDSAAQRAGAVAWSGQWILTGGWQTPPRLWNVSDAQTRDSGVNLLPAGELSTSVAISSDGTRLAVGSTSGQIRVWDVKGSDFDGLSPPNILPSMGNTPPLFLAFDPKNSKLLLATYGSPDARLWNVENGAQSLLKHPRGSALQGAFDPQGRFLVTASNDGSVQLWLRPLMNDPKPEELMGHRRPVFSVDVQSDGTIVSGGLDGFIRLWSEEAALSWEKVTDNSFSTPESTIYWTKESRLFVSAGDREFSALLPKGFDPVAAALSVGKTRLAVVPRTGRPLLFLVGDADMPGIELSGPSANWKSVAFKDGDRKLVAWTTDGEAYAWPVLTDLRALKELAQERLPFDGSERIKAPVKILCRLIDGVPCEPLAETSR